MFYPFMTLNDNTEILHSPIQIKNGNEEIQIYIEKPYSKGFHSVSCFLPTYRWEDNKGFSQNEILEFQEIIESAASVIYKFAKKGGFGAEEKNAANF